MASPRGTDEWCQWVTGGQDSGETGGWGSWGTDGGLGDRRDRWGGGGGRYTHILSPERVESHCYSVWTVVRRVMKESF